MALARESVWPAVRSRKHGLSPWGGGSRSERSVTAATVGGSRSAGSRSLTDQGLLIDFKIEPIPLAVADVDRAVAFYGETLGWPVNHDHTVTGGLRFVQVTPPGSACSFCFREGLDMMPNGSSQLN